MQSVYKRDPEEKPKTYLNLFPQIYNNFIQTYVSVNHINTDSIVQGEAKNSDRLKGVPRGLEFRVQYYRVGLFKEKENILHSEDSIT